MKVSAQTVLNLIKWLLQEQSDLGLHCLTERLQSILGDKQMAFVVNGALRVNIGSFNGRNCVDLDLMKPAWFIK